MTFDGLAILDGKELRLVIRGYGLYQSYTHEIAWDRGVVIVTNRGKGPLTVELPSMGTGVVLVGPNQTVKLSAPVDRGQGLRIHRGSPE